MDKIVSTPVQEGFQNPQALFSGLGADAIALLAQAGADLALILDADGRIVETASSDRALSGLASSEWAGRAFADTVTVESREKIAELLQEAQKSPTTRARQVNHPGGRGPDVPISYRIVSFTGSAHRVALGRDLRTMADIQQRLIRAQVEMEKDLRKMRDVESRYRILFHLAQEPLIVLDAQTMRILDANEGASRLLDRPMKKLLGAPVAATFAKPDQTAALDALASIASRSRAASFEARPATLDETTEIRVTPFREAGRTNLLMRIGASPASDRITAAIDGVGLLRELPDALVLVDEDGAIVEANGAFLDMARAVSFERIEGKRLDAWLGASVVDLQVLLANLKEHGAVKRFASIVRDEFGGSEPVEISAARSSAGDRQLFALSMREAGRQAERMAPDAIVQKPHMASQFTDLVGRVPLQDLVRDTAAIIAKLCIEAALKLTDNNRASAADMLGLSRQSLYIKLRRYGLMDAGDAEQSE